MTRFTWISMGLAVSGLVSLTPRPAEACGGFFCDGSPNLPPMAVDQTGENILFVMGEGTVEAHIQIQYDPDTEAQQFGWVIPLMSIPEFSVGSQPLFDTLLDSTVPSFGIATSSSSCGTTGATSGFPAGTSGDAGGDSGEDPGPQVVHREVVGAFEVEILSGGTAEQVSQWLEDNQYLPDPNAIPILDEYIAEGFMFGAFKLRNDAETAEVHPVVLKFQHEEACVPLRLTRIAAVDDMDVRTFFLAQHRVIPENYRHVLINPLKLDWPSRASNYKAVITQAVDQPGADGNAFVTEYAGPSSVVDGSGLFDPLWDSGVFADIVPTEVVEQLASQGLAVCRSVDDYGYGNYGYGSTGGTGDAEVEPGDVLCSFPLSVLGGLLRRYLPAPEGVEEGTFYGCLSCFADEIDQDAWDGPAFAADLEERVIEPGARAHAALGEYSTLTRMYTTISPLEMMEDPLFHQAPGLPEVDWRAQTATRTLNCDNADVVWRLPDGREVFAPGGVWPAFDDQMPWVEAIENTESAEQIVNLVANTPVIERELGVHNCRFNYPSLEECQGTAGTGGGEETVGPVSGGDTTGIPTSTSEGGVDPGLDDDGGGCGCRSHDKEAPLSAALLALFAVWGRRRRTSLSVPRQP